MTIPEILVQFLDPKNDPHERFNAIRIGGARQPLHLNFWTLEEIRKNLEICKDWDVAENMIPFYGDWHTIICLDTKDDTIIALNDAREIIQQWPSLEAFKAKLTRIPDDINEDKESVDGLIKVKLDF